MDLQTRHDFFASVPSRDHVGGGPEFSWSDRLSPADSRGVIALIAHTVDDGGTLGFARRDSHTDPSAESDGDSLSEPLQAIGAFVAGLNTRLEQGAAQVLLGRLAEQVVVLAVLTQSSLPNCRHIADLSKGVVHPDFRGRGLVVQAFSEIVSRARSIGVELLTLDVREGSRAHRLWQAMGFNTFGVLEDYARCDGRSHRGHYMSQRVDALAARLGLN